MTTSTQITDYMGRGTHAARPTTPNVPSGGTAIYFETDTTNTFAWDGSGWVQINGGGGGGTSPTIVQHGISINAVSVTLGAGPTNGNLLVALCTANSPPGANTGWQGVQFANHGVYAKFAGSGESATQTPLSGTPAGPLAIFEISNGATGLPWHIESSGGTTTTAMPFAYTSSDLIIGLFLNAGNVDVLSSVTGGTVADTITDGVSRSGNSFYVTSGVSKGVNSIVCNWPASENIYGVSIAIPAIS